VRRGRLAQPRLIAKDSSIRIAQEISNGAAIPAAPFSLFEAKSPAPPMMLRYAIECSLGEVM
jgi:hypothetical protein